MDGNKFSNKVAEHMAFLQNIEKCEKAKIKDLPPLKSMLDTLKEYMVDTDTCPLVDGADVVLKIGGRTSKYYHACYWMTKLMLLRRNEKQRCVILHGAPNSGKTRLARYTAQIFDSYWKHETKGIYDERITQDEAHK